MRVPDRSSRPGATGGIGLGAVFGSGAATGVGLGAVFAVAVAFQAYQVATSWGAGYWPFGATVAVSVCALALARRRSPLWTAVAGLAVAALAVLATRLAHLPAEPSPAASLGLAVLAGSAVRRLPVRSACAVAAAGPAVVAGGFLAAPGSAVPVLSGLLWLAALALGGGHRLLAARHRAVAERVRRDERLELARELHDVVAHHVTSIVLQAQAARLVTARHPERTAGSLADIEAAGSEALAATRHVVGLLRDTAPAAEGRERLDELTGGRERLGEPIQDRERFDELAKGRERLDALTGGRERLGEPIQDRERLGELVEGFGSQGRRAHLRLDAEPTGWPPQVSSTVYRIVREALTNVSRHAPHARTVTVGITQHERTVTVEVEDDAPQVPARRYRRAGYGLAGYGLIGMRERVEALGGTLTAGPRPGSGWSVRATVPTGERR
ncbi:sensor histidine kinase [Streptosporangium sp. NPDC002721]|uniref:sensor histidine kinase n=1 Tax=Streptosporangium sp. NPDC002721 TaxID=3366188 RepID=UPI003675DD6C